MMEQRTTVKSTSWKPRSPDAHATRRPAIGYIFIAAKVGASVQIRFMNSRRQRFIAALSSAVFLLAAQVACAVETVTVVEYYNQSLDAYFITARPNEQASLDSSAGFSRTGTRFVANAAADATPNQTRICRVYISSASPYVSSHFYGAEKTDCALIQANLPAGFSFEGYDFAVTAADATGTCPVANKVPIYRAFRAVGAAAIGKTPNHRYTASLNEYNAMIALGWAGEGVAYCTSAAHFPVAEPARVAAVKQVAAADASCASIAPFYYEIGDASGARVSGSIGPIYSAATQMPIASASKWFYGAYVTQALGGSLTADDIRFLTFTSGHVTFNTCAQTDTVGSCAVSGSNGAYTPAAAGKFVYAGSHMQTHAANFIGLGALANAGLASTITNSLGLSAYTADFRYTQPQLAGGINTSANTYTAFLRKLLDRSLIAGMQLNANAVCTNSQTCTAALYSPFPATESPNYSIGHWVEDTLVGDGAYSSAGAFGFYPWIEPTKANYDVLARVDVGANSGAESLPCGRKLRLAWATGLVQ